MISSFFITANETANGDAIWVTPSGVLYTAYTGNSVLSSVKAVSSRGRPVTYALVSGTLPPGLTLNPTNGKINGVIPLNAIANGSQTFTFTISALD